MTIKQCPWNDGNYQIVKYLLPCNDTLKAQVQPPKELSGEDKRVDEFTRSEKTVRESGAGRIIPLLGMGIGRWMVWSPAKLLDLTNQARVGMFRSNLFMGRVNPWGESFFAN